MKNPPVKIAAVSYLNTVPFIYGIEHASLLDATLLLSPPSRCAQAYAQGHADIALVPVGALPELENYRIITPFCIGAHNPVRTVTIHCNSPIQETKRLFLDSHSRTSVLLARVLCRDFWHISPEYIDLRDYSIAENPSEGDAFLFIGDKVFDYEPRFAHHYDLSQAWRQMTGLPFVFAVWIAREGVSQQTVEALAQSLSYGSKHIPQAVHYYGHSGKSYAENYLTNNIDFDFDAPKKEALALFMKKAASLR